MLNMCSYFLIWDDNIFIKVKIKIFINNHFYSQIKLMKKIKIKLIF